MSLSTQIQRGVRSARGLKTLARIGVALMGVLVPCGAQDPATPRLETGLLSARNLGLDQIFDALFLPSGDFVVAGRGDHSLVWVSREGLPIRRVRGRPNDIAPRVGLLGDSLIWVNNSAVGEARLYSLAGDSVGKREVSYTLTDDESLPLAIQGQGMISPRVVAIPTPDQFVIQLLLSQRLVLPSGWPARAQGSSAALLLTDALGRVTQFLAWEPSDGRCRPEWILVPFCAVPRFALAPSGDRLAIAETDTVVGDSLSVRISILEFPGIVRRDTTIRLRALPLTRAQKDSARNEVLRRRPRSGGSEYADRVARLPIPDHRPAVVWLTFGTDGTLWVTLRRDLSADDVLVLARDLSVVAWRRLPPNTRLIAASRSDAILKRRDPDANGPIFRVRW